jgi:hypothetical protein
MLPVPSTWWTVVLPPGNGRSRRGAQRTMNVRLDGKIALVTGGAAGKGGSILNLS